jgi:nucleotide-binding universal stress UspA family protein
MATDLSQASIPAAKYASRLAKQLHGKLELLHIVPPELYIARPAMLSAELQKAELARGKADLHDFASKIPELRTCRHHEIVLCGATAEAIVETAEQRGADLLVMGSHGRSGTRKLALGSIAEEVIRRSHRPAIVIGPGCAQAYATQKSVLLAVNLPLRSLRAAQYAFSIARQSGAVMTIAHVLPAESSQADSAIRSNTRRTLLSLVPRDARPSKDIHIEVTHGDVPEEILRIAQERQAGLIVIGPRERAILADHAPGAVLSKIIRKAKCPVLAITPHIC